ncbi:MAG: hypothetical protein ACKO11_15645 [Cuspidothrix sp.]
MESIEKQILALSHKVDAIYSVIERLDGRLSEALPNSSGEKSPPIEGYLRTNQPVYKSVKDVNVDETLEHKDVLIDRLVNPQMKHKPINRQITPEIEIQRLTTQLTAAYHRIAALEEQLLKQRV